MNNSVDTTYRTTTATFTDLLAVTPGSRTGLEMVKGGSDIVLLIPSRLTYGTSGQSTTLLTIPANACLKYEYYNITVTNY